MRLGCDAGSGEDHAERLLAGTRNTSKAKPGIASLGTTTSKTANGSRHRDDGRPAPAQFGLDPELPVTGEQLRTLMDVRRPDNGAELRRVGGSG